MRLTPASVEPSKLRSTVCLTTWSPASCFSAAPPVPMCRHVLRSSMFLFAVTKSSSTTGGDDPALATPLTSICSSRCAEGGRSAGPKTSVKLKANDCCTTSIPAFCNHVSLSKQSREVRALYMEKRKHAVQSQIRRQLEVLQSFALIRRELRPIVEHGSCLFGHVDGLRMIC